MPAQAGIQYAAALRISPRLNGILDHPLSRVMTSEIGITGRNQKAGAMGSRRLSFLS
jgi:hypothetical protein